jgi:hypothetical protein
MYSWLIFVHVLAVFGFLAAHGAAVALTFTVRGERKVERLRALLQLSKSSGVWTSVFLLVVLATGITAGFLGNWWGHFWIWAALGVLVLIYLSMYFYAVRPFERIRLAVMAIGPNPAQEAAPSAPTAQQEALAAALQSFHPLLLTLMGGIGLAILLWLMMFKPF